MRDPRPGLNSGHTRPIVGQRVESGFLRILFTADDNSSGRELWEIPHFGLRVANAALSRLPNDAIDVLLERFGGASAPGGCQDGFELEELAAFQSRLFEHFDYDVLEGR